MNRFAVAHFKEGYSVSCFEVDKFNAVIRVTPATLTREAADDICDRLNAIVQEAAE